MLWGVVILSLNAERVSQRSMQVGCLLWHSHTEAVRGGGRSKERYGLNRAKVGGSSRGL